MILAIVDATVAVALITSASTLFGGALASGTTIIINRNQSKHEAGRASLESKERKAAERRQISREAYLNLLNALDEVESKLEECWRRRPPAEKNLPTILSVTSAENAITAFESASNVAQLEGPQYVIDAAAASRKQVSKEFRTILRLRSFRRL